MHSSRNETANDWMIVNDIASLYGKSVSTTRLELKSAVRRLPKDEQIKKFSKGKGRRGDSYHPDLVKSTFGQVPIALLTDAQRSVFNRKACPRTVRVNGGEPEDLLAGLLISRRKANIAYITLVSDMIRSGQNLRIRCITGTDFFNAHNPNGDAFNERLKRTLDRPKVLLTYPFGRAAHIRSAAEGDEKLPLSQFSRDARSTFEFIEAEKKLRLSVLWADDLPPSLLVWSEEYALVEPYDHGRQEIDRPGCIGRKAPIMVVNGGTTYHQILKNGFDHIFGGVVQRNHVRIFSHAEVEKEYRKMAGADYRTE